MRNTLRASVAMGSLLVATVWIPTAVSAAPAAGPAPLTAAQANALAQNANQKVIVVLKDQVPQAPASRRAVGTRSNIVAATQHAILGELSQTRSRNVHSYTTINAVAATVSPGEAARLASNPSVAKVVPDQLIRLGHPFGAASPNAGAKAAAPPRTPVPGACPAKNAPPLLAPQALQTMHVNSLDPQAKTARSLGYDGAGVTVGFIADGLDINNTDFIRADGSHVFVDYKDFSGEGTAVATGGGEAFLDASSIAAQGRNVYNISNYSALPLKGACRIRIEGVAPGASLVGLTIFGAEDAGFNSSFLQAIDYAVAVDHVNVLNESLGENFYPDDQASLDLIKQANDQAVAAGTTVTISSGDAGVTNTTGSPSTDPNVIAVGASTTYQVPVQLGYGGSQFGVTGWLDNNISSLSSSGFEQDGTTISLVAPGELNWALCTTNIRFYGDCTNFKNQRSAVQESGGTSESAPLTAGAAALVIQAYRNAHGGATPSPALVKQFLTSTADDIYAPADAQGAGLVNAYRAVIAARSYKTAPVAPTPPTLVESRGQFNAITSVRGATTFTEQLTNVGSTPAEVDLSSRTLGAYSPITTVTVQLSDTTSGHSLDYQGFNDNYEVVHFDVPSGADRLNGSIAFAGASAELSARVRLALVDPSGKLADYSLPQGIGNYGNAQVAKPAAGTWTAYIWGRGSADGGTTGSVLFGASVAKYKAFGTVSPAHLTIAPGATSPVTLSVASPSTPGDLSGSLVITSANQEPLAVPVTLRALARAGSTKFSGVLTGGNGRDITTGVTAYYQLDLPAGQPAFNASVTLADNPNNQMYVWLIDPEGQAQAFQSNSLVTQDVNGDLSYTNTLGANVHVLAPAAGRWTVIINFAPTVSGSALSEAYTVSLNQRANPVTATGLPKAGKAIGLNHPAVVKIKVTNNGTAPEAYFVDGRTNTNVPYSLESLSGPSTSVPLTFYENIPFYLVPSQTTSITGTASTTGPTPIQFDLGAPSGDPDIVSNVGSHVTATVTGNPVSAGLWSLVPDVVGAWGATGAPVESVDTTLTAVTKGFDPAVLSPTGDLWQAAIGGPINVSPIIVQPGQSALIPVIIAPTGPVGTTVSGVLYLDDDSLYSSYGDLSPNANTVAAFPYSYTIAN